MNKYLIGVRQTPQDAAVIAPAQDLGRGPGPRTVQTREKINPSKPCRGGRSKDARHENAKGLILLLRAPCTDVRKPQPEHQRHQ